MVKIDKGFMLAICLTLFLSPVLAQNEGPADEGAADPIDHAALTLNYRLGLQALARGDFSAAETALDHCLSIDPMAPDCLVGMGKLNRAQNKLKSAFDYYSAALAVDPDHVGAIGAVGQLYMDVNRPDRAQSYLDRLISLCAFGCAARTDLAASMR